MIVIVPSRNPHVAGKGDSEIFVEAALRWEASSALTEVPFPNRKRHVRWIASFQGFGHRGLVGGKATHSLVSEDAVGA